MPSFFPPIGASGSGISMYDYARVRPVVTGTSGNISIVTRRFAQRIGDEASWASKTLPADFRIVYVVDGVAVSGVLTPADTFVLDSTTYADGWHAVSVILVEGTNAHLHRCIGTHLKINNAGSANTTGKVPAFGLENRGMCYRTPITDLVDIPLCRPSQNPSTYSHVVAPPAHTLPDPSVMKLSKNWITEPLCTNSATLYQGTPAWYKDTAGWTYIDLFYPQTQPEIDPATRRAWETDFYPGPRHNNAISPYATYQWCKFGIAIWALGLMGDFFKIKADGTVEHFYGPKGNGSSIPVKDSPSFYTETTGGDETGTHLSLEGAIDFTQHAMRDADGILIEKDTWFVADMRRDRIIRIDASVNPAQASVYLDGIPSVASIFALEDGSLVASQLARTYEGVTYVKGLVVIAPDKTVRSLNVDLPGLVTPMCIRPTSDWKIIIADQTSNWVYEIDPVTDTSRCIAWNGPTGATPPAPTAGFYPMKINQAGSVPGTNWTWLAVDRLGTCGPVDDVLIGQYRGGGNIMALRIPRFNTSPTANIPSIQTSSGGYQRIGAVEFCHEIQGGHYPWALDTSPHEARILSYGGGNDTLLITRGRVASDPKAGLDLTAYNTGRSVLTTGTIEGFPFGVRPSFTSLYNVYGGHKLGLKTFDDLANLSDVDLVNYIQSGMGGSVPRPEIVGYPLLSLMYFIRKNSTRALTQVITPPVKPADKIAPVISNVAAVNNGDGTATVTWDTNEPTLGYVAFGPSLTYHRWSDAEAAFGLTHTATLQYLPTAPTQFSVRCTDLAGNVTFGANVVL